MNSVFFEKFQRFVTQKYPSFEEGLEYLSPLTVSPEQITLPKSVESTIHQCIQAFYALKQNPIYQKAILGNIDFPSLENFPGTSNIVSCFDFHISPEGPKLIEINTNASGSLLVYLLHQFYNSNANPEFFNLLQKNCFAEAHMILGNLPESPLLAIVDETPADQKTYYEFLWLSSLAKQWGWQVVILDPTQLTLRDNKIYAPDGRAIHLVYNRFCDFLLDTSAAQVLKEAYLKRYAAISPSVHEFTLLSDKDRFTEWSSESWWEKLNLPENLKSAIFPIIPKTIYLSEETAEWARANRKNLFFKPSRSFGSKSAYKGKNISQSVFQRLVKEKSLAQEYIPSAKWHCKTADTEFKYDLRIFTSGNSVLFAGARLFQGQLMNFKTPLGGFAPVVFV